MPSTTVSLKMLNSKKLKQINKPLSHYLRQVDSKTLNSLKNYSNEYPLDNSIITSKLNIIFCQHLKFNLSAK